MNKVFFLALGLIIIYLAASGKLQRVTSIVLE